MIKFVAFLRGINVGGHKKIKMDELKSVFETMGFSNVKTFLASGNVLFTAASAGEKSLSEKIEKQLMESFGMEVGVILRNLEKLQKLAGQNPFSGIEVTPQKRLYVTFLSQKVNSSLKIPYESPDGHFKILHATAEEVCSVLTLSPDHRTVDLMSILEKEFGRKVTTRNWNTILKILKAGTEN